MKKAVLLFIHLFFFTHVFCQSSIHIANGEFGLKNSINSFFKEEKLIWSSPIKIKKKDWNYILPAAAGLGIIYTIDQPIRRELTYLHNHQSSANSINKNITYLGDGAVNIGISSLFILNGLIFKNHKSIETGYLSTKAIVHAGIVVFVLKTIAGRERPFYTDHQGRFHLFNRLEEGSAFHSFPSGHTITAFSMATVIAKEYRDKKWVGVTSYGLASLVGMSRIGLDKHWASDVFIGSVLGYAIGNFTFKQHQNKWHVFPSATTSKASINLIKQF
jgi:membrane-associated phospholipid phosphatase